MCLCRMCRVGSNCGELVKVTVKKLVRINMPYTFSGLGQVRKIKEFLLKNDNYHDVEGLRRTTMSP